MVNADGRMTRLLERSSAVLKIDDSRHFLSFITYYPRIPININKILVLLQLLEIIFLIEITQNSVAVLPRDRALGID